jgi:hypothetical protein
MERNRRQRLDDPRRAHQAQPQTPRRPEPGRVMDTWARYCAGETGGKVIMLDEQRLAS